MTLRHALSELALRGLVTRTVGTAGGTFVAEPKLEQDLTTLAGFSEQLRGTARWPAPGAGRGRDPGRPAAAAALKLGARAGARGPADPARRRQPGRGRALAVPGSGFPGLLDCRLDGSLYELLEVRYGKRPHRAREWLEPVTAGVRDAEALEIREGAPLMLVERTAFTQSGQPVEFARDLFRGDRTRIVMWTSELADGL